MKINNVPFEQLARSIDLKILEKHNALKSIEALLYGQAGLLSGKKIDDYTNNLIKEYKLLRTKFNLTPIENSSWKMLRLRPANFPTIRISQLAKILSNNPRMASRIINSDTIEEIKSLFKSSASPYWNDHYLFGKKAENTSVKHLGEVLINSLIINHVVPFLFFYGKSIQNQAIVDKSLYFLEHIK
jgi:hypothetical protein